MTVLWALGVLIGLGRIAAGLRRVAVLIRSARPLDGARYGLTFASVVDSLGVDALPPVLTSSRADGPVVLGLLRPRVVLPEWLPAALTGRELGDVLAHECAHAVRRDPWVGLLQRVAGAVFWPHPLVHYLNGQLDRAREEVCDNYVLLRDDTLGYARTLLALTERCRPLGVSRTGLGLVGFRWTLADRVAGLLDPGRAPATRTSLRARATVAAALAAAWLVAASVRLVPPAHAEEGAPPVAATGATAPETPGGAVWTIKGVVVDETGRPVAGAVVRPPAAADQMGIGGGMAGADGTFVLTLGGRHPFLYGLVAEAGGGALVGLTRDGEPLHYGIGRQ